jgi:hypothetical protein
MRFLNHFVPKSSFTAKILPSTSLFFRTCNFPHNLELEYNHLYKERVAHEGLYFDISKQIYKRYEKESYVEKLLITTLIHKNNDFIILENNSILFNKNGDLNNNYALNVVLSDFGNTYTTNYKICFDNFKDANKLDLYYHFNHRIQNIYDILVFPKK